MTSTTHTHDQQCPYCRQNIENSRHVEIAEAAESRGLDVDRFIKFMDERFPAETSPVYIAEWADRIKRGSAYAAADSKTTAALKEAGY